MLLFSLILTTAQAIEPTVSFEEGTEVPAPDAEKEETESGESETEPAEVPTEATPAPAPAPAQPTASPKSEKEMSLVKVELTMKNGLVLDAQIAVKEAMGWSPGKDVRVKLDDGEWVDVSGENLEMLKTIQKKKKPETLPEVAASSEQKRKVVLPTSARGFKFPNYTSSRYLYAPSAISMKKGSGYVSQKLFLFTSAAYAVNDNWTLLGGTFTFFPPVMTILGTKYSIELGQNLNMSVGGESFMSAVDSGSSGFLANIGFVNFTVGDEDLNLTVGGGAGKVFDDIGYPIVVGGLARLADSMSVVTENWMVLGASGTPSFVIGSVAFRYTGEPSSDGRGTRSVDFGLFGFFDTDSFGNDSVSGLFPMPWLDFAFYF